MRGKKEKKGGGKRRKREEKEENNWGPNRKIKINKKIKKSVRINQK